MTCEKPLCQKIAHHKNFTYRKNQSSPNNQILTLFKFSIYTFSVSLHRLNIHSNIQRLLSFHTYSIVHQNHLRLWGGFPFSRFPYPKKHFNQLCQLLAQQTVPPTPRGMGICNGNGGNPVVPVWNFPEQDGTEWNKMEEKRTFPFHNTHGTLTPLRENNTPQNTDGFLGHKQTKEKSAPKSRTPYSRRRLNNQKDNDFQTSARVH